MIEQPEYKINQNSIAQQPPSAQTRDPTTADVQSIQNQSFIPQQPHVYNQLPVQQPAQSLNSTTNQPQPQVYPSSPQNNQILDSFDLDKAQDRFDPNMDYYRDQSKKNSELFKF